jgi:hypothetical protein
VNVKGYRGGEKEVKGGKRVWVMDDRGRKRGIGEKQR